MFIRLAALLLCAPTIFASHLHYFKFAPHIKQHIALMPAPHLNVYAKSEIPWSTAFKPTHLGMNDVPVFNQGMYGSCVTFAMSAMLDTFLTHNDWISPACLLTLGRYLEDNGYQHSGWQGLMPDILFARLKEFGFIRQADEKNCLNHYPIDALDIPPNQTSPLQYHRLSHQLNPHLQLNNILNYQAFLRHELSPKQIIDKTRAALTRGERVLIGVLIPAMDYAGAAGHYKVLHDTWILTTPILERLKNLRQEPQYFGGHQMIVTGFDDDAMIFDSEGQMHQGLFTLRNSWGHDVGDNGNFYMSYAYLAQLSVDLKSLQFVRYD